VNAPVRAVVWDWNGTLLDDVEASLTTMNTVLQEYGRPALDDADNYRATFGFPVREFYRRVGFEDEEVFLDASRRYLELFPVHVADARPTRGADEALRRIADHGIRQVLISATTQDRLHEQVGPHDLADHFEDVLGISCGAENPSKLAVVAGWLRSSGLDPRDVVMVGDTNHDEQIAEALAVQFIRFSNGHQLAPERTPWPLAHSLSEVADRVLSEDV